jgi:hypothetical protein
LDFIPLAHTCECLKWVCCPHTSTVVSNRFAKSSMLCSSEVSSVDRNPSAEKLSEDIVRYSTSPRLDLPFCKNQVEYQTLCKLKWEANMWTQLPFLHKYQ